MKRMMAGLFILAAFVSCGSTVFAQGKDVAKSKDHPMLGRMQNFIITSYEEKEFDSHEFKDKQGNEVTVEGRKYSIQYEIKEGAKIPTPLQITRNYVNAIKNVGGFAFEYTEGTAFLNLAKEGRETWVEVFASGESYILTIVEKAALRQEVTANDMLKALNEQGRIALYIHFDTGKATIKAESQPIINQIVELLKSNPDLKVGVEGHTDSVGDDKANKTLSDQRAASVVAAIVTQGVDAKRLSAAGFGEEKPLADNTTEQGRAKNRRVELVKK